MTFHISSKDDKKIHQFFYSVSSLIVYEEQICINEYGWLNQNSNKQCGNKSSIVLYFPGLVMSRDLAFFSKAFLISNGNSLKLHRAN